MSHRFPPSPSPRAAARRRTALAALAALVPLAGPGCGTAPDAVAAPGPAAAPAGPAPAQTRGVAYVAVVVRTGDPHDGRTPDFAADRAAYAAWRASLLEVADALARAGVAWSWQTDWNFLNAVLRYEVQDRDASLLAATGGKNVVRHLAEDRGVEVDPHSSENDGYNYADVAYLIAQCGVAPGPVVGGHVYDAAAVPARTWTRFNTAVTGQRYRGYLWRPALLTGAATADGRAAPAASGIWRPLSGAAYFTAGGSGIPTFGGWEGTAAAVPALVARVRSGALPATGLWTATVVLEAGDLATPGYVSGTAAPAIAQLASLRDAGQVRLARFDEALARWRADFRESESVYRP